MCENFEVKMLMDKIDELRSEQARRDRLTENNAELKRVFQEMDFVPTSRVGQELVYCPAELLSDAQINILIERLEKHLNEYDRQGE